MYLDAAYVAKFYLNEEDSDAVRMAIRNAGLLVSSAWSLAEVTCAFHRYTRERELTATQCKRLTASFLEDVDAGFWEFVPVSVSLLRHVSLFVSAAPPNLFLRAGDAVHLITALDQGEPEIWTNDRHLLAAAPNFGIAGRSV